jgi:hypothetical protein
MACASTPSAGFVLAPDAPLLANMAALWAADPALARRMEQVLDQAPYPVEPTRADVPTVALPTGDGRRIYLHSRHQPLDEARRLVDTAQADLKTVFCIHGLGLGYHVQRLFEQASEDALHIILEPDLRLVRTAFEHRDFSGLIASGRAIFLTEPDRGQLMVRLSGQQAMLLAGLSFVAHGPSLQLHGEFHRQMQAWMTEYAAYCRTSLNTAILNGQRTCENIARNLRWYVAAPGIARLERRHGGQPAIIVSAGPSLRRNRHLLADAAGRAVIIAVQSTLKPLLEMGIEPNYVTSLDYHHICTRFFEGLPGNLRTELVAEPKASDAVLSIYPGPISILGNDFADELVRELGRDKPRMRDGATVAHLAFYLAEYMGCDPIAFVGQDLGFGDGLCYTPGTAYEDVWRPELGRFCTLEMRQWEHIVRERPILRRIEDWQGRPMYTEERLFAYLQQFERDFAASPAQVIDATEGGAKKRGAAPMPLAEVLARFCTRPLPAVAADHPGLRADRLGPCLLSLQARRQEAGRIEQIGRETLPLLEEVRDHLDDQGRVNRIIAKIDGLRCGLRQVDHCYQLITALTQYTEVLRFRTDRLISAAKLTGVERQRQQVDRDIVNVRGIVDAAGIFIRLMDDVAGRFSAEVVR